MNKKHLRKISLLVILTISLCGIVLADNNMNNNIITENNMANEIETKENILNEKIIENEEINDQSYKEDLTLKKQEKEKINSAVDTNNSINFGYRTIENGIYRISTALDTDKLIDSMTVDGISVQIWHDWNALQQNFEIKCSEDGYYTIKSKENGKVLAVDKENVNSGSKIIQQNEQGTDQEKWIIKDEGNNLYSIITKCNTNLYLDVSSGDTKDGTKLQVYENNGTKSQRFEFNNIGTEKILDDGTYRIAMFSNQNLGLSVEDMSKDNGANVLIWDWTETNNNQSKFNIKYNDDDGCYTITNVNSGKLLDVENGGTQNGTNVWQYEKNGTDAQKWKIKSNSNGSFSLIAKHCGLNLDVSNGNIQQGGNVQIYEGNDTISQQFMFIKMDNQIEKTVDDGIYEIKSVIYDNKSFDMNDEVSQIQLSDSNGLLSQRFKITYNMTYYTISSTDSSKVLAINNENQIIQKVPVGDEDEKWRIISYGDNKVAIESLFNNYFIDVQSNNMYNGIKLQAKAENDSETQKYYLFNRTPMQGEKTIEDGIYKISTNLNNNQVMDVYTSDGNGVQLWNNWEAAQQNFEITYNNDGYYTIKSKINGKVLAVNTLNVEDGTSVIQQDEQGTDQEKWIIKDEGDSNYSIISKANNYYIDVPLGNASNGVKLQMYENNGTISQKFKFVKIGNERTIEDGVYRIALYSNENIGLDIAGNTRENGGNILIGEWTENNISKEFNVKYIEEDGCYIITNINSGKVIDAENGGTTTYTNVWQYEYNGTVAQKWYIEKEKNGSYSIHSKASGLCLDVENGNLVSGSNVRLFESNNTVSQQFNFIKQKDKAIRYVEDGLYKIITKLDQNIGLDIAEGSMENGANLQIWQYTGIGQEKFEVEYIDGYYFITVVHSKKVLEVTENNNIVQNEKNISNDNQKWSIVPDGNGAYNIICKANGLFMDVENGSTSYGTNVRAFQGNGTLSQLFIFGNCGINIDSNKYPGIEERVNNLVANHPNWQFEVLYTGLDFYTAVQGEYEHYTVDKNGNRQYANLVDTNVYKGDWIAPNPVITGNWAQASYNGIAYFMDPRNFLNDVDAFQFVDLADYYNSGATLDSIQYQVNGTFLNNFAEDVRISCEHQNVNPYYIIARLWQEQGKDGSDTIYMDGGDGNQYFNPFNIGALNGDDFNTALAKAKEQGWDSMQKGIEGGITFVKQNYLDAKQNTLYLNKFDVNPNSPGGFYTHQYMQNLSAAYSEARTFRNSYVSTGTLDNKIKFIIPVYENMPSTPAARPSGSGTSTDPNFPAISDQGPKNVQVVDIQTSLKVRSGPGTQYGELERLKNGTILLSVERYDNGWQKVVTPSGTVGYCSGEYLQFINDVTNCNERIAISTSTNVNVRIGPGQSFTSLGTFVDGTTGTRILKGAYTADGYTWDLVILDNGIKGFVAQQYLRLI